MRDGGKIMSERTSKQIQKKVRPGSAKYINYVII